MSAELTVSGLTLGFYGSPVLRGVDLVIGAGKLTGLIGPNGAGKSTLFNAISGLFRPDGGRVRMGEADTTALPPEKMVPAARAIRGKPITSGSADGKRGRKGTVEGRTTRDESGRPKSPEGSERSDWPFTMTDGRIKSEIASRHREPLPYTGRPQCDICSEGNRETSQSNLAGPRNAVTDVTMACGLRGENH